MSKTATRKGVVAGEVAPAAKAATDWEGIELKYRAGVLTVREIARQHGVSHTIINRKAKDQHWTRDLTERVKKAVSSKLVVSNPVSTETEQEVVDAAANTIVAVVREHRGDIARQRSMAEKLLEQLGVVAEHRDSFEAVIDEVEDGSTGASSARRAALMRAVSLPSHAGVLKDLATVLKTVVALEREAFNIAGQAPEPPPAEDDQVVLGVSAAFVAKMREITGATFPGDTPAVATT